MKLFVLFSCQILDRYILCVRLTNLCMGLIAGVLNKKFTFLNLIQRDGCQILLSFKYAVMYFGSLVKSLKWRTNVHSVKKGLVDLLRLRFYRLSSSAFDQSTVVLPYKVLRAFRLVWQLFAPLDRLRFQA